MLRVLTRVPARLFIGRQRSLFCGPAFRSLSYLIVHPTHQGQPISRIEYYQVYSTTPYCGRVAYTFIGKRSVLHLSMPRLPLINIHQLILD